MARYMVNERAIANARRLIESRQYVLDSDWGDAQPHAADENRYLESHSWEEFAAWHLGLTEGATDETKARYAFVLGDFRRIHRSGIIACHFRAAEWRHSGVDGPAQSGPFARCGASDAVVNLSPGTPQGHSEGPARGAPAFRFRTVDGTT